MIDHHALIGHIGLQTSHTIHGGCVVHPEAVTKSQCRSPLVVHTYASCVHTFVVHSHHEFSAAALHGCPIEVGLALQGCACAHIEVVCGGFGPACGAERHGGNLLGAEVAFVCHREYRVLHRGAHNGGVEQSGFYLYAFGLRHHSRKLFLNLNLFGEALGLLSAQHSHAPEEHQCGQYDNRFPIHYLVQSLFSLSICV